MFVKWWKLNKKLRKSNSLTTIPFKHRKYEPNNSGSTAILMQHSTSLLAVDALVPASRFMNFPAGEASLPAEWARLDWQLWRQRGHELVRPTRIYISREPSRTDGIVEMPLRAGLIYVGGIFPLKCDLAPRPFLLLTWHPPHVSTFRYFSYISISLRRRIYIQLNFHFGRA